MIRKSTARRLLTCLAALALAAVVLAPTLAQAAQPESALPEDAAQSTPAPQGTEQPFASGETVDSEASSTAADEPAEPSPYILFLGRAHQLVVHFPIALLIVALLIEMIALLRKQSLPSTPGLICFSIGAISAGFAAWFGWINATEVSASSTLETHRWLGVVTASLAGAMLLIALIAKATSWKAGGRVYGLGVFVCAAIVGVTGHFGGAMVYGHTYLVEMFLPEPSLDLASISAEPIEGQPPALRVIDFETHIEPILEARCLKCHGRRRSRGDLRLDGPSHVFTGNPEDWVIVPGDPDASYAIELLELPFEDKAHMPYKKAILPPLEIAYLRLWILEGAVWGNYDPSRAIEQIAEADPQVNTPQEIDAPLISSEERAILLAALDTKGVLSFPVAEDTDTLDVNASLLGDSFADADLELLAGLEPSVEVLNLARTGVTDAGSAPLANFTHLRRLYLENTQIGDDTLAHLSQLNNLEYLNLYGTQVTDAGLEHLANLPKLRKVYLWQSEVTPEGAAALRAAIQGIEVDLGEYETVIEATEEEAAADTSGVPASLKTATEIPGCCDDALQEGKACDHACCVEAATKGEICQKCLGAD